MTVDDLRHLFDYAYWANGRLFDVLARITDEEFTRRIAGSYGSVRNTLVHALSAEWGWLERCGGAGRGPALKADDYPTARSVVERWNQVETHVRAFLDGADDADLDRPVTYTLGDGPPTTRSVGQLLHHAAVHGVHHRGQVSLLLRELGKTPGNVDLLMYYGRSAA